MNFIAFDFETANNTRSSICSIGFAVVEHGRVVSTDHILVKPTPNEYNWRNVKIHGITDKQTKNQPTFRQQWGNLKRYFDNKILVAHNAAFDCSVLRFTLDSSKLGYPDLDYYCTYRLSKEALNLDSYRLSEVSKYFKIKLNHHNAESDAKAAALIALKLCEKNKVDSLDELSKKLGFRTGTISSKPKSYQPFSVLSYA